VEFLAAVVEAALFGAMVVLERNQKTFQGPEHTKAEREHERQPHHEMNPDRRAIGYLRQKRRAGDHKSDDEDNEDCWTVSRIREAEIEAAGGAARSEIQKALEQSALATARAAAVQSYSNRILRRVVGSIPGHASLQ